MSLILPQSRVKAAGKFLAQDIPADKASEAAPIFAIAHEWRASHVQPLKAVRMELVGKIKKMKRGSPTAARLKRMSSIRGKLAKGTVRLHDMQDVAGCRVILPAHWPGCKINVRARQHE